MKMEFGEDGEPLEATEELGLAARLTKKTKTTTKEKKEKGEDEGKCYYG